MKLSKTARQNLILLVVATVFFLVAKGGWDEMAKTGLDGLGMFGLLIGGLPFGITTICLLVRLWDMD